MRAINFRHMINLILWTLILTAMSVISVRADFENLDLSFGFNGAVYNHLQLDYPQLVRQSDGKILKFGNVASANQKYLHRFNADGSIDTGFGDNGQAIFYNATGNIYGVTQQSDGKILFVTKMSGSTYIGRVNTNGSYDSGFGTNGMVFVGSGAIFAKFSPYKPALNFLLQSIAVLTYNWMQSSSVIRRLNYNGTFSTSFGTNGSINAPGTKGLLTITATTFQNAAIYTAGVQSDAKVFIKKYSGNGQPDTSFGNSGLTASDYGSNGGYWDSNFTSFILKSNKFYLNIYGVIGFTGATFLGKHSSNGTLENYRVCLLYNCLSPTDRIINVNSDNTITAHGGSVIRKYSADTTTIINEFTPSYTLQDAILQPDGKLITTDESNTIRRYLP